jgi:ligand-binding sensor domain-containing protein/serine phosphatase RsbU (regulator of sigma subunit)
MQKYLTYFILFVSFTTFAQFKNLKFTNYTTSQGLSNDNVSSVIVDSKGFLWIGTWNGLNRWDGNQFHVYKHISKNSQSIAHDFIMGVMEDNKQRIWVYTNNGLSLYKPEIDGFENLTRFENQYINYVIADRNNHLWILLHNHLYDFDYDNKKLKSITINVDTLKRPLSNYVYSCYKDVDTLWLGMVNGDVRKLNLTTQTSELVDCKEKESIVPSKYTLQTIFKDKNGSLWIAYKGFGIVKYNRNMHIESVFQHSENDKSSIGSDEVSQFFEDRQGNLWIACINGNLNVYLPKQNSFYRYSPDVGVEYSIKGTSISCLTNDKNNNIWIGSHGAGLMCINRYTNQFANYNPTLENSKSPINIVTCFYESPNKTVWIGSNDQGLLQYNPQTQEIKSMLVFNRSLPKTILGIKPAGNGKLWLATWGSGLLLYDIQSGAIKSFSYNVKDINSISGDYIKSIYVDDSLLWIASFGNGLDVMNTNTYKITNARNTQFNDERFLKPVWSSGIFKDSKKRLWVSTFNNLFEIKGNELKEFVVSKNDVATNNALQAFEDSQHRIWLPTQEGLALYNEKTKTFQNASEKFGICDNIYAVIESNDGFLWLTTDNGIIKFSYETGYVKRYDVKDGLPGNAYFANAIMKSSDGTIFVGSLQGFSIINPKIVIQNKIPPAVYLTDFQLFSKSQKLGIKESPLTKDISLTDTIILNYSQSVFSICYIGLDLSAPHKVQYAYKLDGFNNNWQNVGSENKATFTNLRQGTYVFKVRACNSDGVWNITGKSVTIIVLPPWWDTWWFKVFVIGLIFGLVIQRIVVYKRRNVILEKLVDHRTIQLTNANEELKIQNEVIEKQRVKAISQNQFITESIQYAKVIQESILPIEDDIQQVLPNHFVFYKPLNIVSGDFYWVKKHEHVQYLVLADCTGHGVPGAFMSLLGISMLNDILHDDKAIPAAQILEELRKRIKQELHQSSRKHISRDGMDMVICVIHRDEQYLEFAGAYNSLFVIRNKDDGNNNKEMIEFKGDKMPVGIHIVEGNFTTQIIPIQKGDIFYVSTDGFGDQMGGENGLKYRSKRFHEFLFSIHSEEFMMQKALLEYELNNWKGDEDQIDDVTVIGFSFD